MYSTKKSIPVGVDFLYDDKRVRKSLPEAEQ